MTVLLYQFDCLEAFPILESQTSVPTLATTSLESRGSGRALRVTVEGGKQTLEPPRLVLALPPRIIEGRPEQVILQVEGDGSGSQIAIEALDDTGSMKSWNLARLDFEDERDCLASLDCGREPNAGSDTNSSATTVFPLQFCRLAILLRPERPVLDIVLHTLHVTGDVRLMAAGIAQP